jgi:uncharacterized peroxidase-related enzyme
VKSVDHIDQTAPVRSNLSGKESTMTWVRMIAVDAASGKLEEAYRRAAERAGFVPNIARVQSLRPKTMECGFDLYCQIMDDPTGISKRERVLIATVVSKVNGCLY